MRKVGMTEESIEAAVTDSLLALLEREGFSKVTVAQVARSAGIDRTTFYRHFRDKEDVVRRFYVGYLYDFVSRFRRSGSTDLASYLLLMFRVTLLYKKQMLALHRAGASYLLLPALTEAFGAERVSDSADPRLRYAIAYHVGGVYSDMLLWFDRDMAETPEQMRDVALAVRPQGAFTLLDF